MNNTIKNTHAKTINGSSGFNYGYLFEAGSSRVNVSHQLILHIKDVRYCNKMFIKLVTKCMSLSSNFRRSLSTFHTTRLIDVK